MLTDSRVYMRALCYKRKEKAGILFYKDRTHTLSLATEAHNSWCHPGQSTEPFTWSTKLTMALHPPMHAQHVTFFSNSCVRSKVDQRFHTVSWTPYVRISPSPCAIRLYLRPKASIYSGGFHPAKLLVKQKQEGTFQPLSCHWCAGSGLYQLVRAKCQLVRDFGGQLASHCILKSAILGVLLHKYQIILPIRNFLFPESWVLHTYHNTTNPVPSLLHNQNVLSL